MPKRSLYRNGTSAIYSGIYFLLICGNCGAAGGLTSRRRSAIAPRRDQPDQVNPHDPFWRCGCGLFSSRRTPWSGSRQPTVNGFVRRFCRSKGSGNADSQRYQGNCGGGGRNRRFRRDSGCVPAHPPYWRAASYLPLRAGWAFAPGHSGVAGDQGPLKRSGSPGAPSKGII